LTDIPPESMIAPKGTNIPGYYRKCRNDVCENYVACPYVWCKRHWIALAEFNEKVKIEWSGKN